MPLIRDLNVSFDDAGLPIVSWRESRGLHSPGGPGTVRIECRIVKDPTEKGVLMFAARGTVREGFFEEAKEWQKLSGFDFAWAREIYNSPGQQATFDSVLGKSKLGHLLHDHDRVLRAFFGTIELPIHINCADASQVELEKIQALLKTHFLEKQDEYIIRNCKRKWSWPLGDHSVKDYEPGATAWPDDVSHRQIRGRLVDALAWLGVIAIGFFFLGLGLWFAGLI